MVALVLLACVCGNAAAQNDTTRPAITLNAADGGPNFASLPAPLAGSVFDVGGMGTLVVSLGRNHSGTAQDWNGTAWSATPKNWAATLAPPDAWHHSVWSVDIPWPSGANLPDGLYTLRLKAYDSAGNRNDASRTVRIGTPDSTLPQFEIVTPVDNYLINTATQGLNAVTGTVSDSGGTGVAYVQVGISRSFDGTATYWNNPGWGGSRFFNATLSAPDANGVHNWSLASGLPSAQQMETGRYYVNVYAFDKSGNRATGRHMVNVVPIDEIAPTLQITFPGEGQQLYGLPAIEGNVDDEGSGMSRLDVYLRRYVSGANGTRTTEYWQNNGWSPSFSGSGLLPPRNEYGWRREQNLPAAADLPPGDYWIAAAAVDRYYNTTSVYRNFSIIPIPPFVVDAQIRSDTTDDWLGENIVNSDAVGQTLERTVEVGATQSTQLRVVSRGGFHSKTVNLKISDWAAFAASEWSARFYDAAQGGNDITDQLTGISGWSVAMSDGDEQSIRVEISAPPGTPSGAIQALTLRAEADATGETSPVDAVKLVWSAIVSAQPDVALSRLDEFNLPETWVGRDELSPTVQQIAAVAGEGAAQNFALQITNKSSNASFFELQVPPLPAGWSLKIYDALQGGTLRTPIAGAIETPSIAPNQSLLWRVEVRAIAPATRASLPLRARRGNLSDEVTIDAALQSLIGLQWSRDGETWTDVTATTKLQSQRYQSLGFRALKALPDVAWPNELFGPGWRWQGVKLKGETVWLSPQRVTGANGDIATATLGPDSFSATIVALPDVDLYLDAARGVMALGETVALSIKARDENDAPLANVRVRLRCTKEGADSGHFGDAPSGELFLLTDAQGQINTTWTAATAGRVQLSVEAVDSSNAVFGEGDVWNMEVTG